jgi:predicted transcriptional regulator
VSTTTIRLDAALKRRLVAAAKRAGKSSHALILEAIAQTVERAEHEDEIHRLADERWAKLLTAGVSIPWDDAKAYLRSRGRGRRTRRPRTRQFGR